MQKQDEQQLEQAIQSEAETFKHYYAWLHESMPPLFFEEMSGENVMLVVHNLIGFPLQGFFTTIHLPRAAIVIALDSADADLRILKNYSMYGVKNYQSYISKTPPPFVGVSTNLRIAQIFFTEAVEHVEVPFPEESKEELRALVKQRNPNVSDEEFTKIISSINTRFLRSLHIDRLILALDMFFRAKTRDNCQYEVRYNEDWEEKGLPSMQIVLAWRNTPKYHFLYRIARIIHRYGLMMKRVNCTYIDPYSVKSILVMTLGIHGSDGRAVWDVADIPDFLRELATVKYFASFDQIDKELIKTKIIPGKMGNFLRAATNFIHQALVHIDPNLYSYEHIEADLCRHPELTREICTAFEKKFDPDRSNLTEYKQIRAKCLQEIANLDTGHPGNDTRRKNVLKQALNLVHFTEKTNFYRLNYTSIGFRLNPSYLDDIPFDRKKKFPELPYAIFFFKGMHFFAFHIRFKDLSRGGVRTIYPKLEEHMISERNTIFTECYNLAFTQQKKNKDIPEGGSKAAIFLKPFGRLESEADILEKELADSGLPLEQVKEKIEIFKEEQKVEYLYQAQRSFIETLINLVNCDADGTLRAKNIIDYWKRPEYIYLGPDENMHDPMIQWIAAHSKRYGYKPGSAFISGKPIVGINHKQFGVTSLGVNVYMEALLNHLGINPETDCFTIKISGGPDGDVAGNQILNLYKKYPETAKLIALTDVSGTIYDPKGLNLASLADLFYQGRPIKFYPPEYLSEGGFLLDKEVKQKQSAYAQQTLCWKNINGTLTKEWLSGSEMNHLFRNNVHEKPADIFIPAGGRPRTLHEGNVEDFLNSDGTPTARGIVEGANLYFTQRARTFLEELGVLIIKDSSANKTGVICSSFEVLAGLVLNESTFIERKDELIKEILERLKQCAQNEAKLLLDSHKETGLPLTTISENISARINEFTYQLLDYLDTIDLPTDPTDPLIKCYLDYSLPLLVKHYTKELLHEVPEHHKKAIIACHLATHLVYKNGLSWKPTVVDILPVLIHSMANPSL